MSAPPPRTAAYELLIVGAGISGICAAYYHQEAVKKRTRSPSCSAPADAAPGSYCILERRAHLGGTWDLFRFPGVRNDSDMYTYCFPFRPWTSNKSLTNGNEILHYMEDTCAEFGIDDHIQYNTTILKASWDDADGFWTVLVAETGEEFRGVVPGRKPSEGAPSIVAGSERIVKAKFLYLCTGFFSYEQPHIPEFPGTDTFRGEVVTPQFWDRSQVSHEGKDIVVIGSGATAVTIAPVLASDANSVVMLQRSPTYMFCDSRHCSFFDTVRKYLFFVSLHTVSFIVKWLHLVTSWLQYAVSRKYPKHTKKYLVGSVVKRLGPHQESMAPNFTPSYKPYDQRICVVADGDLVEAVKKGQLTLVTDTVKRFVPEGVELDSGRVLKANLVVMATGMKLRNRGGIPLVVNGKALQAPQDFFTYRGAMVSGIPNYFATSAYVTVSYTLKSSLIGEFAAKMMTHMAQEQLQMVTPRAPAHIRRDVGPPVYDHFQPNYYLRDADFFPLQGKQFPWRATQSYFEDLASFTFASVTDKYLHYDRCAPRPQ